MKFSIITPTYKRPELLVRAIQSLLTQTYTHWEMIIVNDSPSDDRYKEIVSSLNDPRIRYLEHEYNKGVNKARNLALSSLSSDSSFVILLDDDDYLAPDTLATFHTLCLTHLKQKWFVTNRAYKNGTPITLFGTSDTLHSYIWPYLITKKLKGDATHAISTKLITQHAIRFSSYIKQGEEWFFFYQIGLYSKMYYHDHNSTISDGYDTTGQGLNFRKRTTGEKIKTTLLLVYELIEKKKVISFFLLLYICIRIIKTLFSVHT